jgi:DNA invertase Pin-like site-specific DNA recombinase
MPTAIIGYARVSTDDQNLDLQRDALTQAGRTRIYEDRISGAKAARPGLALALEVARGGDQLVVWRLDRLGRSMSDLIALTRTFQERGVELRSLTEGIDTSTINGKFTFHLFAALAQFERALIRERTQAGLAAARTRPQGRPPQTARPRKAPPRRRALQRQAAQRCRDLPDHGDLQADALQLPRRGQWLRPGRAFPTRR